MTVMNAANGIFADAWKLYVKYMNGPAGDPNIYWDNLVKDSARLVDQWPCDFAKDIAAAVLAEHSRREENKRGEAR